MMFMTELQKTIQESEETSGICQSAINIDSSGFEWAELAPSVDMYITNFLGMRSLLGYVYSGDTLTVGKGIVYALYRQKEYMYNKLYETMKLEYNPLENYDMTETEQIKDTGKGDSTNTLGARNDNSTSTNSAQHNENTTEESGRTDNTLNSTSPSDEPTEFYGKEKTQFEKGNMTTTQKQDLGGMSTTVETTTGSQINSTTQNTENNINRTLTRKGNIGVTTSQRMVLSQREVAMFDLIKMIACDTVDSLCSGVWAVI